MVPLAWPADGAGMVWGGSGRREQRGAEKVEMGCGWGLRASGTGRARLGASHTPHTHNLPPPLLPLFSPPTRQSSTHSPLSAITTHTIPPPPPPPLSRTAQSGGERAHEAAGGGAAGAGAGRSGAAIDGRPLDVSGIKVRGARDVVMEARNAAGLEARGRERV